MKHTALALLSAAVFAAGCSASNGGGAGSAPGVVAKGARVLGMDTNDPSPDFSFVQSYSAAQGIGVGAGTTHLNWNGDEGAGSGATSGAFTDTVGQLASVNAYYRAVGSKVSVTVAPIDTPGFELPIDLVGLPMDNANVIARFNAFIDWVLAGVSNASLVSLQIGNEIDAPAPASTSLYWSQYKTFLTAVVGHLHSVKPGLKIGVTVSLYGLIGQGSGGFTAQTGILNLLPVIDVLGVTYYPLFSNFQTKDPSVVPGDFAQVFSLVGTKPVYVQEIGYPTSSSDGSSNALQTAFVAQVFATWDLYALKIPFLALLRMNDLSLAGATSLAANYGLSGNPAFVAYLQSLGYRTFNAPTASKPAWAEVMNQTRVRGWW